MKGRPSLGSSAANPLARHIHVNVCLLSGSAESERPQTLVMFQWKTQTSAEAPLELCCFDPTLVFYHRLLVQDALDFTWSLG